VAALDGRTPRVYGSDNAQSRITLHATLDSWVQVRDGQGDLLLTRVLRPGDSYRVPDQTGLTLVTGNAGGLRIEVDGTALAPIGRVGMVRRNIALDPQRLVEGTASP
jgi:cytoskeleton protein RodZ